MQEERAKYHLTHAQINRALKAVIIDGLNLDRTSAEGRFGAASGENVAFYDSFPL